MPGQLALAPLPCDDGGHAFVFEPAKEPRQLGPQNSGVGEPSEERLNGIQQHTLGANCINSVAKPYKQPLKVVLPCFLDLAAVKLYVVKAEFLLGYECREV